MVHRVKETEADDVVHEVTINILGLTGIVGNGPIDVSGGGDGDSSSLLSSSSSSSPHHPLTSMKAAIAVLYKNRAQHFGAPPLSERLQYVPTREPSFCFQQDDDNTRTTVIDPKPHYTAVWKRPAAGRDSKQMTTTAVTTEVSSSSSLSTASFDCTLRVSTVNGKQVAKPRRFELVIALVHDDCNNKNYEIQTLAAVPVGVCELVVGQHGGARCRRHGSSSSSSCNKQIMELPVRRVTQHHGYPSLHIPNPNFKPLLAIQKYKQDGKKRRGALLRRVVQKGLCFRGDHGVMAGRRGQDKNDDLVSRDGTTRAGGGDLLTGDGSSVLSIASQKQKQQQQQQQHIPAAAHLEKAVLRVEVEWKIKEFFEVYLEDPLLDRVPRKTPPPRRAKINSPEWGHDDPLRSVPVAAGALITAAFSEVFSCVAAETSDFHARFLETEVDSRALEDIACGVPLLRMAASGASPSRKRGGGHDHEVTRALLVESLADCIVHEDTFPVQALAREASDNSTCHGGIHIASDQNEESSPSVDFLEPEDEIITKHQIHVANLEQGYHLAKDDDSLSTNQSSCLLNPVVPASRQSSLYPTKPIDSPEEEEKEAATQIGKGLDLESSVSASRPPKAQDDLVSEGFDNREVGNGLHVVPYLSIEGDSFLLGDKGESSSPAIHLQLRLPSPIQNHQPDIRDAVVLDTKSVAMQTKPKPNQNQTPMKWIQFDQSADVQSLLTDNADYIKPTTQSLLKTGFQSKTAVKRKPRRGNPFPNLAIVEEKLKMEAKTRQPQNIARYYSKASPLGLQITIPQDGVRDDVSSREAYFADFEDAVVDESFWNGQEARARWNGMGMQVKTTEYAKDASSFQFEADEKSI
jgi:hypothetical protein